MQTKSVGTTVTKSILILKLVNTAPKMIQKQSQIIKLSHHVGIASVKLFNCLYHDIIRLISYRNTPQNTGKYMWASENPPPHPAEIARTLDINYYRLDRGS